MRSFLGAALVVLLACGGESSGATPAPAPDAGAKPDAARPLALSEQLVISEVAVYQTVKIDVMKDGALVDERNAPIVTAKKGLLRVWVALPPKAKAPWRARALDAELHLVNGSGEQVLTDRETIARASDDDVLASTFDFAFDDAALTPDTRYELWVRDPALVTSGGDKVGALRFPTGIDATEALGASLNPGPIKLVLVPVQCQGWLPDTTPAQLERYRTALLDMYPTAKVELSVREPIVTESTDWYSVFSQIADTRAHDAPAADVYYVGAFEPGASYSDYIKKGSLAGLGAMSGKVALILGYAGSVAATALVHELGHNMGRSHAPCGNPAGVDEAYPYSGASLGVNGWSASQGELVPESESDMMSYCEPTWISDYTYAALFAHIQATNAQNDAVGPAPVQRYRRIWIGPDGAMRDGGFVNESSLGGSPTAVNVRVGGSEKVLVGHYFPLDHLAGGYVLVPADGVATEVRMPALTPSALPLR